MSVTLFYRCYVLAEALYVSCHYNFGDSNCVIYLNMQLISSFAIDCKLVDVFNTMHHKRRWRIQILKREHEETMQR